MVIYKYNIMPSPLDQEIYLPSGSKFLSVAAQDNKIMLYCTHESPESEKVKHRYAVVGTGWETYFEDDFPKFIGTVVIGDFVWHVFELHDLPF